jgi:transcriptional regulator with XRE-family HTH domain
MAADDAVREQLKNLGEFIRNQRKSAQMSLRDLADATNVSNPYLSQIENGKHQPSVRVLRSIALALNMSLETMLVAAGLLDIDDETGEPRIPDTATAIRNDPRLTDEQRADLLAVYRAYTQASTSATA